MFGRATMEEDPCVAGTALIVDDHASFRTSARHLLESASFEVVGEAFDTASAREAVGRLRPDVVLLDVQLPDGNGFELARELASRPHGPKVILTSSLEWEDLESLVATSGAHAFVAKDELSRIRLREALA
jgi:DNA-binding NarL/FixJ family response regulator